MKSGYLLTIYQIYAILRSYLRLMLWVCDKNMIKVFQKRYLWADMQMK